MSLMNTVRHPLNVQLIDDKVIENHYDIPAQVLSQYAAPSVGHFNVSGRKQKWYTSTLKQEGPPRCLLNAITEGGFVLVDAFYLPCACPDNRFGLIIINTEISTFDIWHANVSVTYKKINI